MGMSSGVHSSKEYANCVSSLQTNFAGHFDKNSVENFGTFNGDFDLSMVGMSVGGDRFFKIIIASYAAGLAVDASHRFPAGTSLSLKKIAEPLENNPG